MDTILHSSSKFVVQVTSAETISVLLVVAFFFFFE